MRGRTSWCKGTKGIVKANSGSFKKGDKRLVGENNSSWKGGITPLVRLIRTSSKYQDWRKKIIRRDNFTCQKYRINGGKLVAHHIRNFAELIQNLEIKTFEQAINSTEFWSLENGITLSSNAHLEFHKIYGNKNNNREQLIEFLTKSGIA